MLTLVAWAMEIVPTTPDPSMDYAPFFILANHRFVLMISIPYLFVLGVVFSCDIIALLIAIVRKNQMTTPTISSCNASKNMNLPAHLYTNNIHSSSILDQGKSNGCKFMNPMKRYIVQTPFFKKKVILKFSIVIILFCFQSNIEQTQSNCSTHDYCNLTKFGQDWTENNKFLLQCKNLVGLLS